MNRPGTSISKAKVTKITSEDFHLNKAQQEKIPTLVDYIKERDWIGAIASLEN
jgi:intraflagellar transport protein 56